MIGTIAAFEARRRLRMLSTYVYFGVLFALAVFFQLTAGGAIPWANIDFGAGAKVLVNGPWALAMNTVMMGNFGVVITAAIAGGATYQDVEHGSTAFFFTAPISRLDYLAGGFLGAFAVLLGLSLAVGIGCFVASSLPLMPASRVGPQFFSTYLRPYLFVLFPNLVITASAFFCLAALGRRMLPVYVGAVLVLLGYLIAVNLVGDVEHRTLAAFVDPFGLEALDDVTHYWSVAEKNSRPIALTGHFLWNRIVWVGAGLSLLGLTYARFRFAARASKKVRLREEDVVAPVPGPVVDVPAARLDFSRRASLGVFGSIVRLEMREIFKSVLFGVLVLAGLLFIASTSPNIGRLYGTPTYPVTAQVVQVVAGSFGIFLLVILTLYAGEVVFRERDARIAQITDALPASRGAVVSAKLTALIAVQAVLLLVVLLASVLIQAAKGYTRFELGLYFETLFGIQFVDLACLCCLALLVHVLANQKYAGNFLMIVYLAGSLLLPAMGAENHLYRFATAPGIRTRT